MRSHIRFFMAQAFPVMALAGLLLAAWGLLVTPDEFQAGQELSRLVAPHQP